MDSRYRNYGVHSGCGSGGGSSAAVGSACGLRPVPLAAPSCLRQRSPHCSTPVPSPIASLASVPACSHGASVASLVWSQGGRPPSTLRRSGVADSSPRLRHRPAWLGLGFGPQEASERPRSSKTLVAAAAGPGPSGNSAGAQAKGETDAESAAALLQDAATAAAGPETESSPTPIAALPSPSPRASVSASVSSPTAAAAATATATGRLGSQGRGRPTFAQMQQEARGKLGGLAAQQLERQQQERQQQERQQQSQREVEAERQKATASAAAALSASGIPSSRGGAAWSASSEARGTSSEARGAVSATASASGAGPGPMASERPSMSPATAVAADGRASSSSNNKGGKAGSTTAVKTEAEMETEAAAELDPDLSWDAMRAELAADWQRVQQRWRQFVERPLEPPFQQQQQQQQQSSLRQSRQGRGPPPSTDAGGVDGRLEVVEPQVVGPDGILQPSSTSGRDEQQGLAVSGEEGEEGVEGEDPVITRHTAMSRVLLLACVGTFVAQWAPVVQAVASGGMAALPLRDGALALLLACPPTPLTVSWQADVYTLASGQLLCLLSSAFLHSGLLSLLASVASLGETAPWLETFHGFMIMLLSYAMAGAATGAAQMMAGGQSAGIGGIGAALGMEAAVAVRCLRMTGSLPPLTPSCVAVCCAGLGMAVYQPLVGPWGIVGGILGGALSGVLAYDVLWLMRVVLGVTLLVGIAAWNVLTWVPRALWRVLLGLGAFVWGTLTAFVGALKGV